jgi:hypothetical protein
MPGLVPGIHVFVYSKAWMAGTSPAMTKSNQHSKQQSHHARPDRMELSSCIAHHELAGFGGMGEGMSIQIAKDGRRIIWLAHESAPKNFTAVDVSDPRKPKVVTQTELPQSHMRSNSLEVVGDIMAVAYQVQQPGQKPAGFELFDISVPENPKSIAFVDRAGDKSRGVHQLWFCDGEYVHMASGAADFVTHNQLDDQCYQIFDVRSPSAPKEVGRWWMPGTRVGDKEAPPVRHTQFDMGFRAHNTNVYPQRPDRCYLGYIDAGMYVLDITDKANPKPLCRWDNSPPYHGFTHTVLPLFERSLFVVTDESVVDDAADWPKLVWILDARDETNPVPISTCPAALRRVRPPRRALRRAQHPRERAAPTAWHSDTIIIGTFFNGGLRAYDIADPYQPKEGRHRSCRRRRARAARHDPAQRRVRRRAARGLHGRPACRRAVRAGDGFLTLHFPSPDIGLFGRRQRHARGHRIPLVITGFGRARDSSTAVVT